MPGQARWRTLRSAVLFVEKHGHCPTVKELAWLDRASRGDILARLEALVDDGYVRLDEGERVVPLRGQDGAEVVIGKVERVEVPTDVRIRRGKRLVGLSELVNATGEDLEAMKLTADSPGLRIKAGDWVICERGRMPGRGEPVVCDWHGKVIVRIQGHVGAGLVLGLARSVFIRF